MSYKDYWQLYKSGVESANYLAWNYPVGFTKFLIDVPQWAWNNRKFIMGEGDNLRGTKRDSTGETKSPSPSGTASTCLNSAISSLSFGSTRGDSMRTAVPNYQTGLAIKKSVTTRRASKSKYASNRFASKLMFESMCPLLRIVGHIPVENKLIAPSGKQLISGDTTASVATAFTFPSVTFLRQLAYKIQVDLNYGQRGGSFSVDRPGGTEGTTTGNALTVPFGTLAAYAVGGSATALEMEYNSGPPPNAIASQTHNLDLPGIILKSYKRMYKFLNVGTSSAQITIYQWVYVGNGEGDSTMATLGPKRCWEEDLKLGMPYQPVLPATASSGVEYTLYNNMRVNPVYTKTMAIEDLGTRPAQKGKLARNMQRNWACEKVTTIVMESGQSAVHTVYVPGFYVSAADLLLNVNLRNKTRSLMFITSGEVSFEGGAETTASNKIGCSPAWINYEIESEALVRGIPHNRPSTTFVCNEDLTSTDDRDYAVTGATKLVRDIMYAEKAGNADTNAAINDNATIVS